VLYAQVQESVKIRGDRFTVLVPHASAKPLIVNSEMLTSAYGVDGSPDAPKPKSGSWVVVGGVLQGTADVQGRHPVLMRVFGWAFGPALGPKIERRLFVDEMEGGLTTAVASAAPPAPTTPETPAATDPTTPPATTTPAAPTRTTTRRRPKAPPRPRPKKKPGEPSFFGL